MTLYVFQVAGIVIVVGAFIIKFGSGLLEKEVTTLLNKISYNNVQLGTLADAVAYIMIIGGFFIISIALLGMCGAWHDIRGCLWAVSTLKQRLLVCVILLFRFQCFLSFFFKFCSQQSPIGIYNGLWQHF